MRLRQLVQAANFNRFHRAGLSATQFMALNVIPKQGITLSELARELNLSPASLNQTVNSLEERGLLQRSKDPGDARKMNIFATKSGEQMQNAASAEFRRFIAVLFSAMKDKEREGLLHGLERMVKLSGPSKTSEADAPTSPHADAAPLARRNSRRSRPA